MIFVWLLILQLFESLEKVKVLRLERLYPLLILDDLELNLLKHGLQPPVLLPEPLKLLLQLLPVSLTLARLLFGGQKGRSYTLLALFNEAAEVVLSEALLQRSSQRAPISLHHEGGGDSNAIVSGDLTFLQADRRGFLGISTKQEGLILRIDCLAGRDRADLVHHFCEALLLGRPLDFQVLRSLQEGLEVSGVQSGKQGPPFAK